MKIKAYAKINLTLDITGVRDDGFHTLRSVMAPISLCDELTLEKSDALEFDCNIKSLCTEDNLCVRAAKLFFEESGIENSVKIYLEKNIPFPAGLGGGSSDAAAVLKGLNTLYENPLTEDKLFSLAEKLGSDVSLCLLGNVALCEGRGEVLTELKGLPKLDCVIAIGKGRLSTPEVYRQYDAKNLPVRNDTDIFLNALKEGNIDRIISSFGNAFEPVTDELCPETMSIRELMMSHGAKNSRLSGSGPSVFGIFADKETAENAKNALIEKGYSAYTCETL